MCVQYGVLYLILTKHKFIVHSVFKRAIGHINFITEKHKKIAKTSHLQLFRADPDRIGLLGKPPACSIRSPSRASSHTRLLCSPHANASMKQYECGRTQPLFRAGHDRGINKWSKPKRFKTNH
jgi:hypothetical protein